MASQQDLFSELPPEPSRRRDGRVNWLAGMFATWRYGDAPKKKEREAAFALAEEVERRISGLPEGGKT